MEDPRTIELFADAKASRLSRVFGKRARIHATPDGVSITDRHNRTTDTVRLDEIRDVRLESGLFGSSIVVQKSVREAIRFNVSNSTEAQAVVSLVRESMRLLAEAEAAARKRERQRIAEVAARREKSRREEEKARREAEAIERRKREALARREAARLTPLIKRLAQEKDRHYSARKYVRYSDNIAFTVKVKQSLGVINQSRSPLVDHMLGEDTRHDLQNLEKYSIPEFAEKARQSANTAYKKRDMEKAVATAHRKLGVTLTSEQSEAVATDEDNTLVLAGAGSGKTAIITAKLTHLVEDLGADPSRILVLAFNNKAAAEITERLPEDLDGITVKTFHAMGIQTIAEAHGARPSIYPLASDEFRRRSFIENAIREAIHDPKRWSAIYPFLSTYLRNIKRPFDFNSESEYLNHTHKIELRSLNGDLVKSREELIIANLLFSNGVRYEYEKDYREYTADRYHSQYKPDFYLTDYDIYIEHFALDEYGNAPTGWEGYAEDVGWKRETHQNYGTKLIETHSWQNSHGILQKELISELELAGVKANPVPYNALLEKLRRVEISNAAILLDNFLKQVKTYNESGEVAGDVGE